MRSTQSSPISLMEYSDYRLFLKDFYQWAHAKDRSFSHRFISSKVGSSSSGWFSDVLKSRQNITGAQIVKLVALFKLGQRDSDYFETLVQFNQSSSLDEKNRYYRKLVSLRDPQAKLVGQEQFEYFSKWYYSAIRELLFFYDFRGDYQSLAKKLSPPIRLTDAIEAINLLKSLNFIHKDSQGCFRPLESTLKKDTSFKSLYSFNYLKASMELGVTAMERFSKEERHISAMTLSYSEAFRTKAVAEIETFRNKLLSLMEEDSHPEKVFQMNLQFFPLTQ